MTTDSRPPGKYIYVQPDGSLKGEVVGDWPPGANIPVHVIHQPIAEDGLTLDDDDTKPSAMAAGLDWANILKPIIDFIRDNLDSVTATVGAWFNNLQDYVGAGVNKLGDIVTDAWDVTTSAVKDGYNTVKDWISDRVGDVSQWIDDGIHTVGDWLSQAKDTIVDFTSDVYEDVRSFVGSGLENVQDFVSDGLDNVGGYLSDFKANVQDGFNSVAADVSLFARDIGDGITSGMNTVAAALAEQTKDIIKPLESVPGLVTSLSGSLMGLPFDMAVPILEKLFEIPARTFFNLVRDAFLEEVT